MSKQCKHCGGNPPWTDWDECEKCVSEARLFGRALLEAANALRTLPPARRKDALEAMAKLDFWGPDKS